MPLRTQHISESDPSQFVHLLGEVFGDSPWVAEQAYLLCPFTSRENLIECMVNIMQRAPEAKQQELLRSHPGLGACEGQKSSTAGKNDQASALLNQCNSAELARIERLEGEYRERFGYPFIIDCTGLDKVRILSELETRLQNPAQDEFNRALVEVEKIARNRIYALVSG